jgi:hypothetical protein
MRIKISLLHLIAGAIMRRCVPDWKSRAINDEFDPKQVNGFPAFSRLAHNGQVR